MYGHTDWGEFLKYAVEMGSGAVKFHKDWFRHSKVNKGGIHKHGQHGGRISLL
jgi:hypothetical protein